MRVQATRTLAVGAVGVMALGAMAACGSDSGGGANSQVIFGESTGAISNFMPLISAGNSTANGNLVTRVFGGLYRAAPSIAYITDPDQGSASSAVVNGQQVVTIKINPKAVWGDGQPVTSADYKFTVEAQDSQDPKKGGCADLLNVVGFDQVQSVATPDKQTATITFKKGESFADWKGLFSAGNGGLPLLSKHIFDKGSDKANCAYITKGWPVAQGIPDGAVNGPWLIQQKSVDTQSKTITLTPNPKYWGDKPKLKRVIYKTIGSESDTNIKALQNDEVNIIYPQPQLDLVANLKKLSNVKTEINFGSSFEHLDFNTKDPLLKNKAIRQAIAYAIDRKALVGATVGQFSDKASVLGNRLILSNQKGYVDNGTAYNSQNIAKAKQLIESAGGKMGSNGIYTVNGKPLSFKVMTTQQNPLRDSTISRIAAQVKAAGIQLTEFANPDIFEGSDKPTSLDAGGFQIALFAWVGGPSISAANSIYFSPASQGGAVGQNYSRICNSQIDTALKGDATALIPAAQIEAANKADKLLWDQMATLPLYQKPTLLAFQDTIQGLADNSTQAGPMWNSDTFSVK